MSTRKIGYFLAISGVVIFLVSLAAGYLGMGDQRMGSSQLLGMEIGIVALLIGSSLIFLYPDRQIDLWSSARAGVSWLLNLPVSVWVITGFLIVYIVFFLSPVFLNSERSMWYFNGYLPDRRPIGLDIRAVIDYIQTWLLSNQSPYADGFIAYPPLALVLFSPMLLIGYPAYYYFITFASLLFHVASTLLLPLFSNRGRNNSLLLFLFALSLFSYGFQFELERGQSNTIAFSLSLIALYLYHSNANYHLPAYFLFTLGVQMKIYPIILIVMFIKNWRDWKGNLKRIAGILMLNFALLFILGFQMFADFLNAVRGQQLYEGSWNGNHSLKGFVHHLALDGFRLFEPGTLTIFKQYQGLIEILFLVIIGICLLSVLVSSYSQNESGPNPNLLLICTICAMIIPSISNDYKLPILTAPMAIALSSLSLPDRGPRKIFSILLVVIISIAYWSTQYPFTIKPYFLTRNFPALFIILIAVTALSFVAPHKSEPALQSAGNNFNK